MKYHKTPTPTLSNVIKELAEVITAKAPESVTQTERLRSLEAAMDRISEREAERQALLAKPPKLTKREEAIEAMREQNKADSAIIYANLKALLKDYGY